MEIRFLTPWAALLALVAILPLGAYALRRRSLRRIERGLGLEPAALASHVPLVLALLAVPVLLGVAAAQPVVETTRTLPARTDAEAFVVLDVSRSMLASAGPGRATRFERARRIAREVRASFPEVPFGLVTLTDRVLPHLFPTTDARVFETTLSRAVGVEKPPPGAFYLTFATNLNALRDLPTKSYFRPAARHRVAVVLTDGETQTLGGELATAYEREPRTEVVLLRLWGAAEAIYATGVSEGYEPSPESERATARLAELVDAHVFEEDDVPGAIEAVRAALGTGETLAQAERSSRRALMPWVALASVVPLAFVLARRNLWLQPPARRPLPVGAASREHRRKWRRLASRARETLAHP